MDRLKVIDYDNGKPGQLKFMDCPFSEKSDFLGLTQDVHLDRKSKTTTNTDTDLFLKSLHANLLRCWRLHNGQNPIEP